MTTRHDKAVITRLMRIKGTTMQGDSLKARKIKLPKKPRKPVGRKIMMVDNENVKPGGSDE